MVFYAYRVTRDGIDCVDDVASDDYATYFRKVLDVLEDPPAEYGQIIVESEDQIWRIPPITRFLGGVPPDQEV